MRSVSQILQQYTYNIGGRMKNWQGFEETMSNSTELLCLKYSGLRKTVETQLELQ
jgi:hypothetical protein